MPQNQIQTIIPQNQFQQIQEKQKIINQPFPQNQNQVINQIQNYNNNYQNGIQEQGHLDGLNLDVLFKAYNNIPNHQLKKI